jgi:p25-alpha
MASKPKKGTIFDRLNDPSNYSGAHRNRFDADGKGRGKAGRTDDQVADLKDITRTSLHKAKVNPKRSSVCF